MKIYMVEMCDYDTNDSVGYFMDYKKAKSCCEYLNRTKHSDYEQFDWFIAEYNLDETDYNSLNKGLDEQERIEFKTRLDREKQQVIEKIERFKEKYNL